MIYIIVLIILSGLVAYIGNWIGRYFGKKRLSIFGLRPRDTATLFTVLSGILVMAITFSTLIIASRDVRIALFGMEKLQSEIQSGREEIAKGQAEILKGQIDLAAVQKEKEQIARQKEKLGKDVVEQKSRALAFKSNEILYIGLIQGGLGKKETEIKLKSLLDKLDKEIKNKSIPNIEVNRTDFQSTLSYVANTDSSLVLKVISTKNVVVGQDLSVKLDVSPNELIFKKNQELLSFEIAGHLSQTEIQNKLKDLLAQVEKYAIIKGLIPGINGEIQGLPYDDIPNTVRRIKGYGTIAKVKVISNSDIFSIGPLDSRFEVII